MNTQLSWNYNSSMNSMHKSAFTSLDMFLHLLNIRPSSYYPSDANWWLECGVDLVQYLNPLSRTVQLNCGARISTPPTLISNIDHCRLSPQRQDASRTQRARQAGHIPDRPSRTTKISSRSQIEPFRSLCMLYSHHFPPQRTEQN
jgi:hypothetical protein